MDGKMKVPKFWRPSCYGEKGVRYFLGNHGEELITPEQAAQIGSYDEEGLETIYISVASYRDPECQPTVSDIYERADHPERIRVAIKDFAQQNRLGCFDPRPHYFMTVVIGSVEFAGAMKFQTDLAVIYRAKQRCISPRLRAIAPLNDRANHLSVRSESGIEL